MTAAKYPDLVKKLILISSGPFESRYAESIMPTRLSRLTQSQRDELNRGNDLKKFVRILFRADNYDPIVNESCPLEIQQELNQKVWNDAQGLRYSGELLARAASIACPVVAIHGDYDPHPFEGVKKPLSRVMPNFSFCLIKNCGHYPWYEKEACKEFYQILSKECMG